MRCRLSAMWARDESVRVRRACVLTHPEHRARVPASCFLHPFILLHRDRSFSESDILIACRPLHWDGDGETCMRRRDYNRGRALHLHRSRSRLECPASTSGFSALARVALGTLSHIELTASLRFILPAFSCLLSSSHTFPSVVAFSDREDRDTY
jgi:hypothetical protein